MLTDNDMALTTSDDGTVTSYGKTLTFYYDDKKMERNGMDVGPFTHSDSTGNTGRLVM